MKHKVKRISKSSLSVVLSLCMLMSCFTAAFVATDAATIDSAKVGATNTFTSGSTLYFDCSDPSGWDNNAVVGAIFYYEDNPNWCFNTGSNYGYNSNSTLSSYTQTTSLGSHIYSVTVPASGLGHVVFVRLNPNDTTNVYNYSNKMSAANRSSDSQNEVVLGGWDNNSSWSTYTPYPYLHHASGNQAYANNSNVTDIEMPLKSGETNIYTVTLPAGEYYFSIDGSSTRQQSGWITGVTTGTGITCDSQNYYVGSTRYDFYKAVGSSGMIFEFNRSTGALTISPAVSTVTLTNNYASTAKVTVGTTTLTAKPGSTSASGTLAQGATAAVKVKPDSNDYKATTFTVNGGSAQTLTYNASSGWYEGTFTVPTASATSVVIGALSQKQNVAVNFSGTNGTVTAVTEDGTTLTSGQTVLEGTKVTFTATPNDGYVLTGWTGLTDAGTKTVVTQTITAATTAVASFGKEGYKIVYKNSSTVTGMTALSNGWYISQSTIPSDSDGVTILRNVTAQQPPHHPIE